VPDPNYPIDSAELTGLSRLRQLLSLGAYVGGLPNGASSRLWLLAQSKWMNPTSVPDEYPASVAGELRVRRLGLVSLSARGKCILRSYQMPAKRHSSVLYAGKWIPKAWFTATAGVAMTNITGSNMA